MLLSGFNVYHHHHTLIGVIAFGLIGDIVGASVAYAIGYYGSDWLEQHGGKIHMGPHRLELAHRWFERFWRTIARRLALRAAGPGDLPVRRRRVADAIRQVPAAGGARLDPLDRRPGGRSGRRPAATGTTGGTASTTSTTRSSRWRSSRSGTSSSDGAGAAAAARPAGCHPEPALPLSEALALGALHGPAELLPISSSGHIALIPWLAALALLRARRGAAQVVRGGTPCGHRGGAADHPAHRGLRGGRGPHPPSRGR